MCAQYPIKDEKHQKKIHPIYCKIAQRTIIQFPLIAKLFNNFENYENLNYKEVKNIIFDICTHNIKNDRSSNFHNLMKQAPDEISDKIISDYVNNNLYYKHDLSILEKALSKFNILNSSNNKFKTKFRLNIYSENISAFLEVINAYKIGLKIGFENVELGIKLENNKEPDIKILFNGKKIYAELTGFYTNEPQQIINSILEASAKYLCKKISNNNFGFYILVNLNKLCTHNNGNLDKEESIKYLCEEIDKFHLDELAGLDIKLYPFHYQHNSLIEEYLERPLTDLANFDFEDPLSKLISNNKYVYNWAKKINCSVLFNSPFTYICTNTRHAVIIYEDTAIFEYNEFSLNRIKNKIKYKAEKHQFEKDHPVLILLYVNPWLRLEDHDIHQPDLINSIIDVLPTYSCITGVLLYVNGYNHYRYIPNPNADENIKLSKSEIESIFPKEDTHE